MHTWNELVCIFKMAGGASVFAPAENNICRVLSVFFLLFIFLKKKKSISCVE